MQGSNPATLPVRARRVPKRNIVTSLVVHCKFGQTATSRKDCYFFTKPRGLTHVSRENQIPGSHEPDHLGSPAGAAGQAAGVGGEATGEAGARGFCGGAVGGFRAMWGRDTCPVLPALGVPAC